MTSALRLQSPDVPRRRVLFAVELLDPVTHAIVHRGIDVVASGLEGRPIVSWSGRFVWLEEGHSWPTEIRVIPRPGTPYQPLVQPAPPPPDENGQPPAGERKIRITLRPTAAYGFDGVILIRGRLVTSRDDPRPVAGALVQLAWREAVDATRWLPAPHAADLPDESLPIDDARTDAQGDFRVMLRASAGPGTDRDVVDGLIAVRLQFTRFEVFAATQVTPDDFPFLTDVVDDTLTTEQLAALNQQRQGRVPIGREFPRVLSFGWNELLPI